MQHHCKKLASHKGSVDPKMRQGAIYQILCHDCNFSYLGETKRSIIYPQKKHLADIWHLQFNKSALIEHVFDNEHFMGWTNAKILNFELDSTKRRFIGPHFINQILNTMNDKQNVKFPSNYSIVYSTSNPMLRLYYCFLRSTNLSLFRFQLVLIFCVNA